MLFAVVQTAANKQPRSPSYAHQHHPTYVQRVSLRNCQLVDFVAHSCGFGDAIPHLGPAAKNNRGAVSSLSAGNHTPAVRAADAHRGCSTTACIWDMQRSVPDASDTQPSRVACDVISCLVALLVFPLVFVIVSCHWLVIVIVSYISLFSKPARKRTTQLYIVSHAQQAMYKLVTGIK